MLTSAADTKHKFVAKGLIVKILKMVIKIFTFKNPKKQFPKTKQRQNKK